MTASDGRWAWVEVDTDAIRENVAALAALAAPARLCAVVKADGYGHGAHRAACAALAGGASMLAVALTSEGGELRAAGIDAPILVLSEQPVGQFATMVAARLTPTLYTLGSIAAFGAAARAAGGAGVAVHLKLDTGMHRVGAPPGHAVALARAVLAEAPALRLGGVFTHLAVADEPADPYTAGQLERFDEALDALRAAGIDPGMVHAANSAGALAHPRARYDMVRTGIAMYGVPPSEAVVPSASRPALRFVARVSHVKRLPGGARLSYGLRYSLGGAATIATVPLGYADGVPRRLAACAGEVLVGGRRRPIAGVVTMDQLLVDCGDDPVVVGDEVVLLGAQGDERITPAEWADKLGTIPYEIVCGISKRIERITLRR